MYRVIRFFTDAQDNEYAYNEGDIYPRNGIIPSDERIRELMSGNNFQRVALIELVKEEVKKDVKADVKEDVESEIKDETSWTAEEINKMPFMKLKSVAKKNGVNIEDKKAEDIRTELIEKLGI